jgi:indolepyruvate ferredoxin oxidoreductase alpha subunit
MSEMFLMGNEAIGLGAIRAGVSFVSGYPGTPSTEVLETVAKHNDGKIHVEWSVNEKAAMEAAAAAAYTGARTMVTMKQVGLNVASDPLMSLAYIGIKGAMVVMVADDPGPISSQTEQDSRTYGVFSKLPVFDPSSVEEAYEMIGDAFEYSHKYKTPVLFRPTTRVCHGVETVKTLDKMNVPPMEGFVKDTSKWVIFPRLAFMNHKKIEERNPIIGDDFSSYRFNKIEGSGKKGIITGGISYEYVKEILGEREDIKIFKVSTPFPFPEKLALEFLKGVDEVLAVEELDPFLERAMLIIAGKHHINVDIKGKLTGDITSAGENSTENLRKPVLSYIGEYVEEENSTDLPPLPIRPPVLCAGCPHRGSFYAVKKAIKEMGEEGVYCGDIGCYTLGNAMPLDMVDTCLCMGAGITMAQGLYHMEPNKKYFAFVGDSTFFASGITGIVNAVYNQADITVCILDNSTTAMTGHQPHPGTGKTMMGEIVEKIDIKKVLEGIGVKHIETVDPLKLGESVEAVKRACAVKGVKAIIFKSPCIAIVKSSSFMNIDQNKCIKCKKCIKEIGCPAISSHEGVITIEKDLCTGCGLCSDICPVEAIGGGENE